VAFILGGRKADEVKGETIRKKNRELEEMCAKRLLLIQFFNGQSL
jgi:hypothetical protein